MKRRYPASSPKPFGHRKIVYRLLGVRFEMSRVILVGCDSPLALANPARPDRWAETARLQYAREGRRQTSDPGDAEWSPSAPEAPPCRLRYAIGFRGCTTFSPMAPGRIRNSRRPSRARAGGGSRRSGAHAAAGGSKRIQCRLVARKQPVAFPAVVRIARRRRPAAHKPLPVHTRTNRVATGALHAAPAVPLRMKPGLRVPNPFPVLPLDPTRTRRLHRRRIDDVDPPPGHRDALLFELSVRLPRQQLPEVVLHKPRPEPTQRRRIRNPAAELKPAEPPERKVPTQALRQPDIRNPIPNAGQQAAEQRLKRVTRAAVRDP